jgi:hypothetical protein
MGFRSQSQGSNPEPRMSVLGHKRTLRLIRSISALPPKADITEREYHVCFVPKAGSCTAAINAGLNRGITNFRQ